MRKPRSATICSTCVGVARACQPVIVGRDAGKRVHGCLVHIDIIDDKIWIQRNGTEEGISTELIRQGIAPERIVLAFSASGPRAYPTSTRAA